MPDEKDKSGEQKAAEADVDSFRKDLGPFVVAAETTRMAMVFTDAKEPGNPIIFLITPLSQPPAAWCKSRTNGGLTENHHRSQHGSVSEGAQRARIRASSAPRNNVGPRWSRPAGRTGSLVLNAAGASTVW